MKSRVILIVGIIAIGFLTGCATPDLYQPPTGNQAELARIRNSDKWFTVVNVDDKMTLTTMQFILGHYPDMLVLTPGKHHIRAVASIVYKGGAVEHPFSPWLWLVAKPGNDYLLKAELKTNNTITIRFWLEDSVTGKEVGGIAGSDDEPDK